MCFALGLLAIEQEEQEKLYQHIVSILGDRDVPVRALSISISIFDLTRNAEL